MVSGCGQSVTSYVCVGEAKRSLSEMRERSEESYQENQALLVSHTPHTSFRHTHSSPTPTQSQLELANTLYDREQLQRQQVSHTHFSAVSVLTPLSLGCGGGRVVEGTVGGSTRHHLPSDQ